MAFITDLINQLEDDSDAIQLKDVHDAFMSAYGSVVNRLDIFGEDSDYDVGRTLAAEFIEKTGLETLPQVCTIYIYELLYLLLLLIFFFIQT